MPITKQTLSTTEIEDKLGIKRNRLKEWIPNIFKQGQKTPGRGKKYLFSRFDLCKILLFKALIEKGMSREEVTGRLIVFEPDRIKAIGKSIDGISFVACVTDSKGQFIDPTKGPSQLDVPGMMPPIPENEMHVWGNNKYYDLIVSSDWNGLMKGIREKDPLSYETDAVVIINFRKLRNMIDAALSS
jgi:hypothetical protein